MPKIPINITSRSLKKTDFIGLQMRSPLGACIVAKLLGPGRMDMSGKPIDQRVSDWLRDYEALSPDASADELRQCLRDAPPYLERERARLARLIVAKEQTPLTKQTTAARAVGGVK